MAKYPEVNLTGGIDDTLVSLSESVTMFPIMLLFFVFILIFIGGSTNQKRRTGTADIPFWAMLSGFTMTLTALLMTLGQGMINELTLGVVFAITISISLWFFLSKVRGEP